MRSAPVRVRVSRGLTALALVLGCGGGGDTGTTPTPPASGGFTISVSGTTPTTIPQAGSGSATVSVQRTGAFAGAVALSIEGAPAGVTITPANASIASGTNTTSLAIDVSLNVVAGAYPITIRGQSSGQNAQTATLNLVVVTRPASVSLSRSTSAVLSTNASGPPIDFTVLISRIEYLGAVALDVASGLPAGVTSTITGSPTGGSSINVRFTVAASTAPGSYTAELRATGTGISPATLSVPFTVLGVGALTVGVSRPTVSIAQNGSGVTSVTVTRTNFTSGVTLAASGMPAGTTATFSQNPIASNGTTLTFVADASTIPGTYPITVTATSPAVPTPATVVMTLVVTPTGTTGNTVFRFCGTPADIPIWFGFQDGSRWTRITAGANNTFTLDLPSPTSVTWVTQHGADDFRINVVAGTDDEIRSLIPGLCPSPANRTAIGSVTGFGATDQVQVVLGPRAPTTPPTFGSPNFSFAALPDGAMDLLATRSVLSTGLLAANRVLLQRNVNPVNGGSVGALDFNSSSAIVPESNTLTAAGAVGGEQLSLSSALRTAGGSLINLSTAFPNSGSSGVFHHLPSTAVQAGDFHLLQAAASATAGGSSVTRTVSQTVASPTSRSLTLGAVPGEPNVFAYATSPERVRFNSFIPDQADYRRLYVAAWYQQSGNTRRDVTMTVTDALAPISSGNLGTNAQIRVPDFTSAPGWNTFWESRPGLSTTYLVSASGWTAAGGMSAPLADGVVTKSYTRIGPVP